MDGDATRLESIERRLDRMERRLDLVQAHLDGRETVPAPERASDAGARAHPAPVPDVARALAAAAPSTPLAPPAWPTTAPAWPGAAMVPAPSAVSSGMWPSSMSLKDLEERFAGRALAWIGGAALVAAAVFFLSLAFSRGWITEPLRVLIGLGVGTAAFAGGAVLLDRRNQLVGHVLAGVGLGILSISIMAATRLYGLLPAELGLLMALLVAIAAAVVAVRFDARSTAALGLVAALAAPPLTGASATLLTLLFVAVTLIGTTAVALYRSWRWLPPLAFVLAAPQVAAWVMGDPPIDQVLVCLAGFWAVNLVAAAGEEVRIRRDDLRPSSATLVLANAVFLLAGLVVTLDGTVERWLGLAIGLASLAHLAVGAWFLHRQGLGHLFGNLVAGTGAALVAIAAFVQLGAPVVPIAWVAEAVALAWLAALRVHVWSALAALVLGAAAILHLVILEYPISGFMLGHPAFAVPFRHPEAGSLLGVLAGLGIAVAVAPVRWVRSSLVATGILVACYTMPFEIEGIALIGAMTGLGLAGLLADRLIERSVTAARLVAVDTLADGVPWASVAGIVPALLAVLLAVGGMPLDQLGSPQGTPYIDIAFLGCAIVIAGLVVACTLVREAWLRSGLLAVALLLFAWGSLFEVAGTALVAAIAVLLPVGVVVDRALSAADPRRVRPWIASGAGALAWSGAAAWTLLAWSFAGRQLPPIPFTDDQAVAAALLAAAVLAASRWLELARLRTIAELTAVALAAWVMPYQLPVAWAIVAWVALAATALLRGQRVASDGQVYAIACGLLWAGALIGAVSAVPPDRLVVASEATSGPTLPAFWMTAFAALAALPLAVSRVVDSARERTVLLVGAGVVALYAISVAVVDAFTRKVGGPVPIEELAKQAQVALSVCWTATGVALLAIGLVRRVALLRHAGFVVLGIATGKVVLVDMASMDVAYRALVLFGLGLLLLAGAWLLTRFRGPRAGHTGVAGGPHPA